MLAQWAEDLWAKTSRFSLFVSAVSHELFLVAERNNRSDISCKNIGFLFFKNAS